MGGHRTARRGQHITREYGIDPFELTRVRSGDLGAMTERVRLDLLVAETVDRSDLDAYAAWCRGLLARGVYAPASTWVR